MLLIIFFTSHKDNKTAVYALMDKIAFPRERYRLGHTMVFFRAGALAILEESRDDIVLKLVRYIQGQCYKHIKYAGYAKRRDQRELLVVCQRNFRKYMALREWGWFIIIQKTRPLIGLPNPEEVRSVFSWNSGHFFFLGKGLLLLLDSLLNMKWIKIKRMISCKLEFVQHNLN
jgi:myosin heavy subunit